MGLSFLASGFGSSTGQWGDGDLANLIRPVAGCASPRWLTCHAAPGACSGAALGSGVFGGLQGWSAALIDG